MSVCHGFVQNTWRKDHCTNCFRMRDEHEDVRNSVIVTGDNNGGRSGTSGGAKSAILHNNNSNASSNSSSGHRSSGNDSEPGDSPEVKVSQRVNRFLGAHSSSTTSLSSSGSSSSIPRMNSGSAINQIGKLSSGTNNNNPYGTLTSSSSSKGQAHSTHQHHHHLLNGSRNNLIISSCNNSSNSSNHDHNESNLTESNGKAMRSSTEAILFPKSSSSSSSSLLSSNKLLQGKGVMMTNSHHPHPSRSDNASVIPPHPNHHHNNKLSMTSSAPSAAAVLQQSSTTTLSNSSGSTTGRNITSSFIASKNIFTNATTSTPSTTVGFASSSSSTTLNSNTSSSSSSAASSGSTTVITAPLPSATGSTGCVNGTVVLAVASNTSSASASSSSSSPSTTCLSHSPQSATSIKRGNTVLSSSSSSSSNNLTLQQSLFKSGGSDLSHSGSSTHHYYHHQSSSSSKNFENHAKNGLIEKWEFSAEGVSNSNTIVGGCGSGKVALSVISQQHQYTSSSSSSSTAAVMNNSGKERVLRQTDTEGENLDRRKPGFSATSGGGSSGGNSVYVGGSISDPMNGSNSRVMMKSAKGILRSKSGARKREKNVRFPDEVVAVIGYGGGPSGLTDDEDDAPADPMDSASVNEVMEKNSTTYEEKELHRLTQKNTNFNSIKTNLLGTTCIEIGPIVGCTGGKSMEGSSKPLVSIGTFETRKEPLRIQKKISEDSADDELNEKTVEKHRKFIPRSSVGGATSGSSSSSSTGKTSSSSTQQPSKIATMIPSSTTTTMNKESSSEIKQHMTVTTLSQKSYSKSGTTTSAFNSTVTANKTQSSTSFASCKTSSSISNKSATSAAAGGNGSSSSVSTTMIEVNPEQSASSSSSGTRGSRESVTERKTSSSSTVTSNRINSSSSSVASNSSTNLKWNNGGGSGTTVNNDGNNSLRNNNNKNKPVLKRIQQSSPSSEGSVDVNGKGNVTRNNNHNLSGEKNNKVNSVVVGNSIANKRNSFLRDCIVDSSKESTAGGMVEESCYQVTGSSGDVQVICKNSGSGSDNGPQTDSLMKSELKVDLKPSVNNGKLSHPPFGECLSNRSNGTDDSSEFDDSLEDSGLDIKKCSEISESDEKSGSGSDSGNENDYSDRDRMKIIPGAGPKSGLFISVDEVEGQSKKPEKLSPDSVLFSSASEMSASGSSESIPEALDTVSNGSSKKSSSGSSSSSGNESGSSSSASPTTSAGSGTKRAAPRPPTTAPPDIPKGGSHSIYANTTTTVKATVVEVEGLYDDVSFYKNPMHFPLTKDPKASTFHEEVEEEEEEEEENIYDDCTTLAVSGKKGAAKAGGAKIAVGSYDFQNGSSNTLDSDGDDEPEKVVHRRSDGIEFIGIRKIDSESFLRERSPTPDKSPEGKRERSSSASPKTRRKVNNFFSTIGKKAGAAFSQHVHGYGKNKSNHMIEDSIDHSPSGKGSSSSAYKRSLSTDEVSMTRTQEIYATLTPTSLKFRGLAPVLHKLSKMDLNLGDRDKGEYDDDRLDSKEKGFKKHKISSSIKKFLRFGSKDESSGGHKYDFGNTFSSHNKTDSSQMITSQISEEVSPTEPHGSSSSSRTPTPTMTNANHNAPLKLPERKPSYGTMSRPPPPPPPRVHSLDLLNRVGVVGPNGTVRPARPPPPSRHNRVAPSFTAVFNNPNGETTTENRGNSGSSGEGQSQGNGNASNNNPDLPDPNNPPSKPKRKASMNLDCVGITRDLETTYNHITTLNLETLKLIASQTPTKIRRSSNLIKRSSSVNPLKWTNFQIPDPSKPLVQGHGFVFYSAILEDESCVLLVQESATAPNFSAPFEFSCVETSATFEDFVPDSFITWKASEYVTSGSNVRVFVSVMPKCNMYTVESYMRHRQVPLLHKYFALLQSMNFWDKEDDMTDLLVLVQSMEDSDNVSTPALSLSPSSVLVYVHPIPRLKTERRHRSSSKTQVYTEFETAMKQILLNNGSDGSTPLLGDNDRQVLLKRLNDQNKTRTVQDLFRLFLQVKLFAPKRDSDELERIKKLKSERAIQQWLDRERALCMKEAVEQTLQRSVESSISPYKRSYLEFLLTPENSAKAVLEMLIDLLE